MEAKYLTRGEGIQLEGTRRDYEFLAKDTLGQE
jgi:hypothetical protein